MKTTKALKLTKSEEKLLMVCENGRKHGALVGLGWADDKFVLRLKSKGLIRYVTTKPELGLGYELTDEGIRAVEAIQQRG